MTTTLDPSETSLGIFQPPLSKVELHAHVLTVLFTQARQLHFTFCRQEFAHTKAQAMLLKPSGDASALVASVGINDPDLLPKDLELDYECVRTTELAQTLDALYDFAYLGLNNDSDKAKSEGSGSWCFRILYDLSKSSFAEAWDDYSPCKQAIDACMAVCEVAEARMTLEELDGDESFMNWLNDGIRSGAGNGLSFYQMSILSGISEPSLRTMANPKRPNALKTQSNGRNTYIEPSDARFWLISKGRYLPVTNSLLRGAEIDLSSETIRSVEELQNQLDQRLNYLLAQEDSDIVRDELLALNPELIKRSFLNRNFYLATENNSLMNDENFLRKLADALRLPADLMILKSLHLHALEELRKIERRIGQANALKKID